MYQELVRLLPESAEAYARVGRVARDTGDLELSVTGYTKALSIEENSQWAAGLGQTLERGERYDEALQAYHRSIAHNPQQVEAYRFAGWLYLDHLAQLDEAIAMFEQAASYAEARGLIPADTSIFTGWGTSHRRLGQHQDALRAFQKALELSPQSVNILRLIGLSYFNLQEYENAVVVFNQALEIEERPEFYLRLGDSYRLLSNCEQAIPVYERVLALDADNSAAQNGLQECSP